MQIDKRFKPVVHPRYIYDLIFELVAREFKLKYKRSLLGIAWSLINPLAQLAVFSFVFRIILPLNIPNYTVFLFTGLLVWNWFQTSLLAATDAIVGNRELVRRPGFPTAILPMVTIGTHFIHFCLAIPVLLLFILGSSIHLTVALLTLPLVIMLQFLFSLGLAYIVSTIHVTFRDTQYLLGLFLMLGFYLTPILYAVDSIPVRVRLLYNLNPLTPLIQAYRTILLEGKAPALLPLLLLSLGSVILLWFGYQMFVRASHRFAEEL